MRKQSLIFSKLTKKCGTQMADLNDEEKHRFIEPYLERQRMVRERLAFFYGDFFVHVSVLLDSVAALISNEEYDSWPKLTDSVSQSMMVDQARSILRFAPYAENLRRWRNKVFSHGEIIHPFGGAIRFNPTDGKVEFQLHDWNQPPTQEEVEVVQKIRDAHQSQFPQLISEDNIWEILLLLNELPVELSRDEKEHAIRIMKRCGTFLPKLEVFIPPLEQFLRDTKVLKQEE